ncbi:hypothetical protein EUGRSUZ_B02035 [Eucalyptus grandis]|uniref:Uncharacterized protein n=2 Tax=Eucalyptus grandis TaxID=71139 RepID=A0A059D3P4_EUCGR|nr:hypothetical protein EUGRSUZ_B02035 [Eucalyptus grandis]
MQFHSIISVANIYIIHLVKSSSIFFFFFFVIVNDSTLNLGFYVSAIELFTYDACGKENIGSCRVIMQSC